MSESRPFARHVNVSSAESKVPCEWKAGTSSEAFFRASVAAKRADAQRVRIPFLSNKVEGCDASWSPVSLRALASLHGLFLCVAMRKVLCADRAPLRRAYVRCASESAVLLIAVVPLLGLFLRSLPRFSQRTSSFFASLGHRNGGQQRKTIHRARSN